MPRAKSKTTELEVDKVDAVDNTCPEPAFEDQLREVEQIVRTLENKDLPLEESFIAYKQGIALITKLEARLDGIEKELITIGGGDTDGF